MIKKLKLLWKLAGYLLENPDYIEETKKSLDKLNTFKTQVEHNIDTIYRSADFVINKAVVSPMLDLNETPLSEKESIAILEDRLDGIKNAELALQLSPVIGTFEINNRHLALDRLGQEREKLTIKLRGLQNESSTS